MKITYTKTIEVTAELTRQAMFNRTFYGLRSQGFKRAADKAGTCKYIAKGPDGETLRCAWGWVDPGGTAFNTGGISELVDLGVGLAKFLGKERDLGSDRKFAEDLQRCHDDARDPADMKARLRMLASIYSLQTPVNDYDSYLGKYKDTTAQQEPENYYGKLLPDGTASTGIGGESYL